jgi:hypothetical protein
MRSSTSSRPSRYRRRASAIGSGLEARTDALFVENLGRYLKGETLLNEASPEDVKSA